LRIFERYIVGICLLTALSIPVFTQAAGFIPLTLKVDGRVCTVTPADLDGDGLLDLVVSYTAGVPPSAKPRIAIFFQRSAGVYPSTPDVDFLPPKGSCVYQAGPTPEGRRALWFFTSNSVMTIEANREGFAEPVLRLNKGSGVLFPAEEKLPQLELVRDWHSDGKPTLLLPEVGFLNFYVPNENGEYEAAEKIPCSMKYYTSTLTQISSHSPGYLVSGSVTVPFPVLADANADGKADLFLVRDEQVVLHVLENDRFSKKPAFSKFFNVRTEDEKRRENTGITVLVQDLDGDNIADLVINKYGGNFTDINSQIWIYEGTGKGFVAQPSFEMREKGFAPITSQSFLPLSSPPRCDFVLPYIEMGITTIARVLLTKRGSVKFTVYPPVSSGFYSTEKVSFSRNITFDIDYGSGISIVGIIPRLDKDFTGDGITDLFMGIDSETVAVFEGKKGGQGQTFSSSPLVTAKVPASINSDLVDLDGDGLSDVIVFYTVDPAQAPIVKVLFNRFGKSKEKPATQSK